MKVKHKEECKRVFKSYDMTCPRCIELSEGAKARKGWNDDKIESERRLMLAINNHDCVKSGCGPVCIAFDH